MNRYRTAAVAKLCGVHPNTVRLYERIGFITAPQREKNGYRTFTDLQVAQIRLIRAALQVPLTQNGLRKLAVRVVQTAAAQDFDGAQRLATRYLALIRAEQAGAEEALQIARKLLGNLPPEKEEACLTRSETARKLGVTIDALRNWEMNGLLSVKRRQNGYRVYDGEDQRRLTIIRTLRLANYSLAAILRLTHALLDDPGADIRQAINTPEAGEEIVSACDRLLTSLRQAERNAVRMIGLIRDMTKESSQNPPL